MPTSPLVSAKIIGIAEDRAKPITRNGRRPSQSVRAPNKGSATTCIMGLMALRTPIRLAGIPCPDMYTKMSAMLPDIPICRKTTLR